MKRTHGLLLLCALLLFQLSLPSFARDRGPRVEIVCPSAPIPVAANKTKVLVYELHITNFDTVPLTLKNLEISIDGHTYSPERFATDWVKVGPNGDSRHDGATKNENWWGWGEPVLAVADGEITEVVDQFLDNEPKVLPPVTLDNIGGNHIILKIAPERFVTYAHLQRGSIKVRSGAHVHRGDVLALLGNSGNTTGAHLHLQVTDRNSVLQSQGVPFVLERFTYLGPGADYAEKQVSEPRVDSIPPGNGVVRFAPVHK